MKQLIQGNMHRIEYIFIYFILLQPILDLFAYLELPLSEIIRVVVMGLGFLYITFLPNEKIQKYTRFYHLLAFVYFLAHFMTNWLIKDPFSVKLELTHMFKTFYFIELLLVYVCLLYSFSKRVDWQKIILRNVIISMVIIGAIMLLANFTDTGKRTYGMLAKAGHTGWFFSGNELSAILVFGFGMTLLLMLKNKDNLLTLLTLPLLLVLIWSMMTVGTKVSYGGLLLLLSAAILITIVNYFHTRNFPINVIILIPLLIGTILWTPYSAIGQNLNLTIANQQNSEQGLEGNVLIEEEGIGSVLSGRNDFMQETISQYKHATIPQQLFGMGYGGNYQRDPKLIEMDFFDWFFGFGIIGIIVLLIPVLSIGFYILRNLLQVRLKSMNMSMVMVGLCVCLGFGIAFVAGHVLSSPAASVYLALLIAYLYVLSYRLNQPNEGLDYTMQKMERILVISTMYPSKENKSFGIFVKNQVEAIRERGIPVDVVAIKESRMGKTILIKKYTKLFLQIAGYFIKNGRLYTTVHAHYVFPSGWLGLCFKRVFKTKLIVTVHGGDIDKMARINSFLFKQTKRVLHAADEVIVVGESLKLTVEGEFQVDSSKIAILNMGVNRNIFQPRDKLKMKKELGIPSHHKIILYVGNLIKAKGLEELVMAFKELKQVDDDLHLHLIGANKEPNFLIFIKRLIRDEEINGIIFHDVKTQTEVAKWMSACETVVIPSYIEGFGLVALEAMACHTAVVGSDVGGLHYLLDNDAGMRVAPQSVKELQRGLSQVLSYKALRQLLIYNGDKKAQENEQQRLIDSLITLYRR